jgi:O-antigen/teichoic acid export membrane protein
MNGGSQQTLAAGGAHLWLNLDVAAIPPIPQTSTRFVDAAHLTLQPLLLNAISVFALAYIIRSLGPTAFGQWAVGTTLNAAVMSLANMGLRPLFVRSVIYEPLRGPELLAEQLGLRIALGLLAAGVATATAIALRYPSVIVLSTLLVGVSTVLLAVWTTFADYLQAFRRVRVSATIATVAGLVLTAISVVVAWAGGGAVALAACYISGPLISTVGLWYVIRTLGSPVRIHWNTSAARRLLTESRPLAVQQFLSSFRDRGEELLVPKFVGIQTFGFFAAGMMPVDRLTAIPDSLNTSYFTSIANSYGVRGSAASAIPEVRQLLVISLAACLAASLAMTSLAPLVARILFRDGGASAAFVMSVTVWSLPFTALAASMACVLQATGHHKAAARAGIIYTLAGGGTSLTLIALIGLPGAAWGVVVRQAIGVAIFAVPFSRAFGSLARIVPFGRIALAFLPPAVLLWSVSVFLVGSPFGLILGTIAGLALFGASLCVLRVVPWPPRGFLTGWRRSLLEPLRRSS